MSTATRLGLYGAGLAVVFGGAFTAADAVVPDSTVENWTKAAQGHKMNTGKSGHQGADNEQRAHGGHRAATTAAAPTRGVTSAASGYILGPITAPDRVGENGGLSFRILDPDGQAETSFAVEHDKKLHLIVVRTDGTQFRHVHPTMDSEGTWSLPWSWTDAGTYRVYADFVPEGEGAEPVTLTRIVEVAGQFNPTVVSPTKKASVDGFTVDLTGDLVAGSSSELTLTVSRDGKPVTTLQPYLGAFGHLVALREGDLAYLHVHPEGEEPTGAELSGPDVKFAAEAPTAGRYLLYLDFQVDGKVHSAPFVLDTTAAEDQSHEAPQHDDATAERTAERDDHSTSDAGSGGGHGH